MSFKYGYILNEDQQQFNKPIATQPRTNFTYKSYSN